jgi:DNA (cytosine-5)-methyltransferase 1
MIKHLNNLSLYDITPSSPTCLDLFSGAGGLSLGFAMAGGSPIGALDNDEDSIKTFQTNFPLATDVTCCAIEGWTPSKNLQKVDVVIGGPPCQGFSLARGLRFVDDPRNRLYKHFVVTVDRLRPSWLVMENVEGILNIGGGVILEQILEDFASIGYKLTYRVINMATFGVPQSRKRAIFVGNRLGHDFTWPAESHVKKSSVNNSDDLFGVSLQPFNSVNSALSDLVLPQGNYFSHRANSQMRGPRNRCAHTDPAFTLRVRGDEFALCELPATGAFAPGPVPSEEYEFQATENPLQDLLRFPRPKWASIPIPKSHPRRPLPVLQGTRRLTIREQARLQTFPDWFEFEGKTTSKARQIGNAVPPLFGYQLFSKIFKFL